MKRLLPLLILAAATGAHAELRVPAFTAYLDPKPEGADVSQRSGITGWNDPALKVLWFGEIKSPGKLDAALALRLPAGAQSKLRLTVAGQSREATATGAGTNLVTANFGSFDIAAAGYQRFMLESLNPAGISAGDLNALILGGPAANDAHFNLKERRNAASVHLMYPVSRDTNVQAFYCEVTGLEDPPGTFYMACGWHRGYLGMQVISATERRIIFSVWNAGNEVGERVKLVAKGDAVQSNDFSEEGTGGHSHLVYPWKTGEKQRFVLTSKLVDATHAIYSGFYFLPDKKEWMLISSWNAPHEDGHLRRLHSFNEDFFGANGQLVRKALFGNQWIQTADGQWRELTEASFSHDATGKSDRLDRFMGVEGGQFFLSHGGFIPGFTEYGEKFTRTATTMLPSNLPSEITPGK